MVQWGDVDGTILLVMSGVQQINQLDFVYFLNRGILTRHGQMTQRCVYFHSVIWHEWELGKTQRSIYVFVVRGEFPGCRLISTASMLEWLRILLPHHSKGSSTERWSRNTLRVVTARVFYVLRGFLTSPFILNNSVDMAAPFNVVSHPRCSEPRN